MCVANSPSTPSPGRGPPKRAVPRMPAWSRRGAAEGINAIPMRLLYEAVYYHMHRWVSHGIAPPIPPNLESAAIHRRWSGMNMVLPGAASGYHRLKCPWQPTARYRWAMTYSRC